MAVLLNTTAAYAQDCGEKQAEITPISTIQGEEWQSPLVGQNVTTSGTVTGKWTANDQLAGFIQSTEPDNNLRTSEGLFVSSTTQQPFQKAILWLLQDRWQKPRNKHVSLT